MKKIVMMSVLIGFAGASQASMKYECNRYVNGSYKGYVHVVANNKAEAESKAFVKFKNQLGKKVDYVKCK